MYKMISKLCAIQDETYIEIISDLIKAGRYADPAKEIKMLAKILIEVAEEMEQKKKTVTR